MEALMSLNLNVPKAHDKLTPKITVVGVGGAGGNAVNNMITSNLEGVEFLIANTDAQALAQSTCDRRIQLGRNVTQGLGAGSRPDIGRAAAEEALDEILAELEASNMVFITAGMGGGTGTGAAPVLARAAREAGILTVGVITKPFQFEGIHRMRIAEAGVSELQQYVDTLIIIPNQNLFRVANEKTTFADAFKMADDVLYSGVRGVTDLIVMPGLINLDFADIQAVMTEMGKAMMGTGEAEAENRAIEAAEAAISNPLLDDVSMKGARGVLINITGGNDLTLFEVDEAANRIRDEVDPDANIIFGSTFDESLNGKMRVSVVATGIDIEEEVAPRPVTLSLVERTGKPRAGAAKSSAGVSALAAEAREQTVMTTAPEAAYYRTETYPEPSYAEPEAEERRYDADETAYLSAQEPEVAPVDRGTAPPEPDSYDREPLAHAQEEPEDEDWRDDSFIAPVPMEPEIRDADRRVSASGADPFAEAEIANGSRSAQDRDDSVMPSFNRKKAYSLFARVTGAARGRTPAREEPVASPRAGHEPVAPRHEAVHDREPMAPRSPGVEASPAPARTPHLDAQSATPRQPRLSGLDAADRDASRHAEEDQLDIPAFLRRQAN